MKHLRQYIRKLILEAASGDIYPKIKRMLDELEENRGWINIINYPRQGQSVDIRWFSNAKYGEKYYNTSAFGGADAGGAASMYPEEVSYSPKLATKLGNCNGAKPIGGLDMVIAVEYGFGPLLYDTILDAVVLLGGATGLTCDYFSVSDDAYRVWDYYLNNRPDIIAKQKDLTQDPRTPDIFDDCTGPGAAGSYGYQSVAKRFGLDRSFSAEDPGEFTPEFIEHWFDPKNPLTKTYHRKNGGTPVIDYLRSNLLLSPDGAKTIGQPYSSPELKKLWDRTIGYDSADYPKSLKANADTWQKQYGISAEELLS